jgi:hypothetical protein
MRALRAGRRTIYPSVTSLAYDPHAVDNQARVVVRVSGFR